MFFFRAFATVLFIFGFSAIVPEFVHGLVVANPRSSLSTEAMTQSDIITERQLNDNDQESDVFDRAAVIQRRSSPVSPAIKSGGGRSSSPKKPKRPLRGHKEDETYSVATYRRRLHGLEIPDECEEEPPYRQLRCYERLFEKYAIQI
ncbi:hypothetical protein MMC29_003413 [Sticta canariensis]|nr:hypothetical protein [Sticta canariensis]